MSGTLHRDGDTDSIPQGWRRHPRPTPARRCDHLDADLIGVSTWCCPDCDLTWRSEQ